MALLAQFTAQLARLPEVFRNQDISALELAAKVEGTVDDYIRDEFIPRWATHAEEDQLQGDSSHVAEFGHIPMPSAVLVKAAYFVEKEVADELGAKEKKHASVQQNYVDVRKRLDKAQERRDAVAKKTCEEIMVRSQDPSVKNTKLARRNQINRVRQGVKKPKKIRGEESSLPEAGTN